MIGLLTHEPQFDISHPKNKKKYPAALVHQKRVKETIRRN
jgi:hypothetical protein